MTSLEKEEDYCLALRQELKEWEQAFAGANNGHKPERADIKKNPGIGTSSLLLRLIAETC